jgi:uncharacterized membrane protein YkvA (DUF1232 family)
VNALEWALVATGAALAVYAAFVAALYVAGRKTHARAVAGFVPDCALLFARLLRDPRVSPRRKLLLAGLAAYLATPIDLVPDFIPVVGQLDDAILVVVVLRLVVRGGGRELVREHWPGPESSLAVLLRLAGS